MRNSYVRSAVFLSVLLLSFAASFAAVTLVNSTSVQLRKGTSNVGVPHATMSACAAARTALIAQDALIKFSGSTTYSCIETNKAVASFNSSSSSSSVASSSSSSAASSSSSSAVSTWAHCANEGQLCAFTGTRTVRFGIGSTWTTLTTQAVNGGVGCSTSWFADPLGGVEKTCQLQSVGSSSSSSSSVAGSSSSSAASSTATVASVQLTWTTPTTNVDGSPLTDLTGYRLYHGDTTATINGPVKLGLTNTYTVPNLATGTTWFFAVSSVSASGGEGVKSNVASKQL